MMRLASPLVLLSIPPVIALYLVLDHMRSGKRSFIRFSNNTVIGGIKPTLRSRLSAKVRHLRLLAIILVLAAGSRPQTILEETHIYVEGIDIVLAVDTSTSMRAMDFEINKRRVDRLEVVKKVVDSFVQRRPNDRIGLVAFAGLAYTVCPLTLDHNWLEENLDRVQIGMMKDGTAIGSAISAALNRLKDTKTKQKIVILLTDGRNNAGTISPMVAAEAAKALGVRVYTIGAGTRGMAPYPVEDRFGNTVLRPMEVEIDEELLGEIADVTGGKYYRATDTESLERIYDEIDKLEKTPIEETGFNIFKELFPYLLVPALALFLAEIILSDTLFRRLP
ncbi:MAG: VWA domain-containing protein [Candidatus Omnitrophica bacterium]|nr:VWA domain-containing protein [Candidatus Omnitrophota bacterium]MDD5487520.1 VWA domain-containing protein [Candidatus Omnitrophota bacterium]